jgi:hypothetical protein
MKLLDAGPLHKGKDNSRYSKKKVKGIQRIIQETRKYSRPPTRAQISMLCITSLALFVTVHLPLLPWTHVLIPGLR